MAKLLGKFIYLATKLDKIKFIVFEGIDGAGKTTQANMLRDYFTSLGEQAVLSPEPSSGPVGNLIRSTLKNRVIFNRDSQKFNEQMAYLFAADRYDHLYNEIDGVFKLIADGFYVLITRYYFSSLAYNGHKPGVFELVKQLNQRFPNPDLVIYIDIPIEVSDKRLRKRSLKEVYETESQLLRVRKAYHHIFEQYEDLLLTVDGRSEKEVIHRQIIDFIEQE